MLDPHREHLVHIWDDSPVQASLQGYLGVNIIGPTGTLSLNQAVSCFVYPGLSARLAATLYIMRKQQTCALMQQGDDVHVGMSMQPGGTLGSLLIDRRVPIPGHEAAADAT